MLFRKNKSTTVSLANTLRQRVGPTRALIPQYFPRIWYGSLLLREWMPPGSISTGYSDQLMAANVRGAFDFGDLIVPGIVSLEAAANVTMTGGKRRLLAIQRQPSRMAGYSTADPVCLMKLAGARGKLEVQLEATAEASLPMGEEAPEEEGEKEEKAGKAEKAAAGEEGAEEAGEEAADAGGDKEEEEEEEESCFEFEAKLAAVASLTYTGEFLWLRDPEPKRASSFLDSGLVEHFSVALGEAEKKTVKKQAQELLRSRGYEVALETDELLKALNDPAKTVGLDGRNLALVQVLIGRLKSIADGDKGKVKARAVEWLEKNWFVQNPADRSLIATTWGNTVSAKVIEVLDKVVSRKVLAESQTHEAALLREKLHALQPPDTKEPANPEHYLTRLCFLKLFGHAGGAEAGLEASVGVSPLANAKAKAGLEGGAQFTFFRFQTFAPNAQTMGPMVMTQDTSIRYLRVKAGAEAYAKVLQKRVAEKEIELLSYNMMTYCAAMAAWSYPSEEVISVKGMPGTGLCFGISVQHSRLTKLRAKPWARQVKSKFGKKLARALGVDLYRFLRFLNQSWFFEPNALDLPEDAVILEAAWAAKGVQLEVTQSGKVYGLKRDYRKKLREAFRPEVRNRNFQLESITARYRVADMREKSKLLFKLGFQFVVDLKVNLRSVEEAGMDAVIDVDTWWANETVRRKSEHDPAGVYEGAVPRVALFHQ